MRRGLAAAAAIIVIVLTAGVLVLRAERRRSLEGFTLAVNRLADLRRLADVKRLAELVAKADQLWPATPERAEEMEAWLRDARALAGHIVRNRAYLDDLEARATEKAPRPSFASAEEQWEHDTLAELVAGLAALSEPMIPEMERRLELAKSLSARSLEAPRDAWEQAVRSIADRGKCPAYNGLVIRPQLGLVPLGKNPRSGLWEFAHLASGEAPALRPDGSLALTEASSVVLVLLPGGTFSMGAAPPKGKRYRPAPNVDPDAHAAEGPVHAIQLAPFFMAKYELTQAQWLQVMRANPSAYPSGYTTGGRQHTRMHPVEQINWSEAREALGRLGLTMPTEAQWEYASRAGTTSVYWSGARKESLQGAANLADRYAKENGGPGSWLFEGWLNDGYVAHAPVGMYRPNPFGLYDTVGNVWEWVEDRYGSYSLPVRPGTGERLAPKTAPRVFRGGGFRANATHARSADRYSLYAVDFRGFDVGVRAARPLE